MIERMKKITLLVSGREKEEFISRLKTEGVVHVKHVNPPVHHEVTFLEDRMSKTDSMIRTLSPYAEKDTHPSKQEVCEKDMTEEADNVEAVYQEKKALSQTVKDLGKEAEWFDIWGDFDPEDVASLKHKGAHIRFYHLKKNELKRIKRSKQYRIIKKEKGYAYLITMNWDLKGELSFEEVTPPLTSLGKITEEKKITENKIKTIDAFLTEEAKKLGAIKKCEEGLQEEHENMKVKFGMAEEGKFSYLQGFCPVKSLKKVISMAKRNNLGYLIEEADSSEETPTLITNPSWIRIIDPVFKLMNTLPGYSEFDISLPFLAFFSLFFAILIGDAGYGLLFLSVTFLARCKFKKSPGEIFFLMYFLSGATIVWGAITGTWFGAEEIARLPLISNLVVEQVNSFSDTSQNTVMFICFVIGVIHLTIAHLIKGVRVINSVRALAELGWIMIVCGMFFTASTVVVNRPFPPFTLGLFALGSLLVLLFQNPQKGIMKGALTTLTSLPLDIIGSFSDIVSYLRLFAVGYASVVVAQSFNNMALGGGLNSIASGLIAALVLFIGHTLNIVLGFMAVIVHGVRLNMLEFSGHLGMQWSGKKYEPFCE